MEAEAGIEVEREERFTDMSQTYPCLSIKSTTSTVSGLFVNIVTKYVIFSILLELDKLLDFF